MNDAPFDVLLFGLLEAEYLLHLDAAPSASQPRIIEREVRRAGGDALRCARVLSLWGARVCLIGNPLADDSNGRLVARALSEMPNPTRFETAAVAPLPADYETPYIVICLASDNSRTILTRHQHAQQLDLDFSRQEMPNTGAHRLESSRDSADASHMSTHAWPQARLAAVCGDHLKNASLHFERAMKTRSVPLLALDATFEEEAEVTLWSTPQDSSDERLAPSLEATASGPKNTVVLNQNTKEIRWKRFGEKVQSLTLPYVAQNANDDLLSRDGSQSVFFAGLLWARLHQWEWERGLRFAAAAYALAPDFPDAAPSLGQIEAVLKSVTREMDNKIGV